LLLRNSAVLEEESLGKPGGCSLFAVLAPEELAFVFQLCNMPSRDLEGVVSLDSGRERATPLPGLRGGFLHLLGRLQSGEP
jgi:hypothetical protein